MKARFTKVKIQNNYKLNNQLKSIYDSLANN